MGKELGGDLKIPEEFFIQNASQESLSTFSSEEIGIGKHKGSITRAA